MSSFKQFLKEEWKYAFKKFTSTVNVFKNPSISELKNKDYIRAFLTKKDELYAWDGYIPAFHMDVEEEFDKAENEEYNEILEDSIPLYIYTEDNKIKANITLTYKTYSRDSRDKLKERVLNSKRLNKFTYPHELKSSDVRFGEPDN